MSEGWGLRRKRAEAARGSSAPAEALPCKGPGAGGPGQEQPEDSGAGTRSRAQHRKVPALREPRSLSHTPSSMAPLSVWEAEASYQFAHPRQTDKGWACRVPIFSPWHTGDRVREGSHLVLSVPRSDRARWITALTHGERQGQGHTNKGGEHLSHGSRACSPFPGPGVRGGPWPGRRITAHPSAPPHPPRGGLPRSPVPKSC